MRRRRVCVWRSRLGRLHFAKFASPCLIVLILESYCSRQVSKTPGGKGGRTTSRCGGGGGKSGNSGISAEVPVVWVVKATTIIVATARIAVCAFVFDIVVVVFIATLRCVLLALATRANQFQ